MAISKDFADYCCELLSGVGSPVAKRMFGGWAVYVEGCQLLWLIDLSPMAMATMPNFISKPMMPPAPNTRQQTANALSTKQKVLKKV